MQRMITSLRTSTLAAAVLALAVAPLAACDKGSGGGSAAVADMMAYIPADAKMVGGMALDKARSSELYKKFEPKMMEQMPEEFNEFKKTCGMDPVKELNSVVFGMQNPQDEDSVVIAVSGTFNQDKVNKCMTEQVKKDGKEAKITKDGKFTTYVSDGKDTINLYWPNDNTVVIAPGAMEDLAKLKALVGGKSIKENKEIMAMVGKTDTGSAMWMAGMVPADMAQGASMIVAKPPKGFYVKLNASSGMDIMIGAQFEKAEDAEQVKAMATLGLGQVKSMPQAAQFGDIVDKLDINSDGTDLIAKLSLSAEDMDKLSKNVPGM